MKKIILIFVFFFIYPVVSHSSDEISLLCENTIIFFSCADIIQLPEIKLKEGNTKRYTDDLIERGRAIQLKNHARVYIVDKSEYNGIIYYRILTYTRQTEGWVHEFDICGPK